MKVIAVSGSPRKGAELIGGIDMLAWDKDDLVHDRPQPLKLARFASEIRAKMKFLYPSATHSTTAGRSR